MTQIKMGGSAARALSIVRPSVIATTFSGRSEKYFTLQRTHAILAGLFGVQAVLMTLIGKAHSVPVLLNYLARDPLASAAAGHSVLALASRQWFVVNLHLLVVVLLVVAGVVHGLLATVLRSWYENGLGRKLNDVRWWAYALIGAWLGMLAAIMLGASDAATLGGVAVLAVVLAFGAMAVEANGKLWPWGLFVGVPIAGLVWLLGTYLYGGLLYATPLGATAYVLIGLLLAGGAAVLANLYLQIRGRREWSDYIFAEEGYVAINLIVTSVFAWVLCAGVLR